MSTLIDLVHEGQDILVDGRSQKIDRFAGRCAAWTEKVEGALQTDPLALSRFRRAERSTITTGVPTTSWQTGRSLVGASMRSSKSREKQLRRRADHGDFGWVCSSVSFLERSAHL
jgi:hypothetical protein